MSELTKPPLETTRIELENILRWEDDGGRILNVGNAIASALTDAVCDSAKRILNTTSSTTAR